MSDPVPLSDDVPFTLSCYGCDCDSPQSYEEAIRDGWTLIQFTPDGVAENYLGLCPECCVEWDAPGASGGDQALKSSLGDCSNVEETREESSGP